MKNKFNHLAVALIFTCGITTSNIQASGSSHEHEPTYDNVDQRALKRSHRCKLPKGVPIKNKKHISLWKLFRSKAESSIGGFLFNVGEILLPLTVFTEVVIIAAPQGNFVDAKEYVGFKSLGLTTLASPLCMITGLLLMRKSIETHRDMYIESYFDFKDEDEQEQDNPLS